MKKRSLPKYVYAKKMGQYLYFIRDGQCISLGPSVNANTPEFFKKYSDCLGGAVKSKNRRTVDELIKMYCASPKYLTKTFNTKKSYAHSLKKISESVGTVSVKLMTRKHMIQMRDSYAEKPATANMLLAVMSNIFETGIDEEWVTTNPAKGVGNLATNNEAKMPWSDAEIVSFRNAAEAAGDDRTVLVMELCLATGQRISDVLLMCWESLHMDKLAGYGLHVTQKKTGAQVFIPFTHALQSILKRMGNSNDCTGYILENKNWKNKPLTYDAVFSPFNEIRKVSGVKRTIHELRHTCCSRLAEIGLDDDAIMAISGHGSKKMVGRYCRAAAQKRRAADAIKAVDAAAFT